VVPLSAAAKVAIGFPIGAFAHEAKRGRIGKGKKGEIGSRAAEREAAARRPSVRVGEESDPPSPDYLLQEVTDPILVLQARRKTVFVDFSERL
jgi:hypothetical protein